MPETTDQYHHIPVKNKDEFVEGSFATIDISQEQGIKAVIGKLKSDPQGATHVQKYLFDVKKWSMSEAEKWISEHKRGAGNELRSCGQSDLRMVYEKEQPPALVGYAVVYNQLNTARIAGDPDGVKERVLSGAFTDCIKQDEIKCLAQHDKTQVLGRTRNGTLKLFEDEKGVAFQCNPPKTGWADDLVTSIKRGDISEMSFQFSEWQTYWTNENGVHVRNVKYARMNEISVVTDAAYGTSSVSVRSSNVIVIDGDIVLDYTSPEKIMEAEKAKDERFDNMIAQYESLRKQWT